jgi:hypothetical protein
MKPSGGQYQNSDAHAFPHLLAMNAQPHFPPLHAYAVESNMEPGKQLVSQAPQLYGSVVVSVHPEFLQYVPIPQSGGTHLPFWQESAGPQERSQPPQFR